MKVKFGALVTDGVGKLGGHQFQRGRYTAHLNTKRTGVAKRNRKPTVQNRLYAQACAVYRRQSPEFQDLINEDWENQEQYTDAFGQKQNMSGFSVYVLANIKLALAGKEMQGDPSEYPYGPTISFSSTSHSLPISQGNRSINTNVHPSDTQYYLKYATHKFQHMPPRSKDFRLVPWSAVIPFQSSNGFTIRIQDLFPVAERSIGDKLQLKLYQVNFGSNMLAPVPFDLLITED